MKQKETWIVTLDFTKIDADVLKYVRMLGELRQPGHIHFINVIKEMKSFPYLSSEYLNLGHQMIVDQRLKLENRVEKYFKDSDIDYQCQILEGNPLDEVINLVLNKSADLVIAGKKKLSTGSGIVSDQLSSNLPCDFLLVPEQFEPKLQKIMVATDFSEHSTLAMKGAHNFKVLNPKIELLAYHRYVVPIGYSKSGKSFDEFAKEMESSAGAELNSWIDDFNYEINPEMTLEEDNSLAVDIMQVAAKNNIDLIVLGSKGQSEAALTLLGSNTLKLLKVNELTPLLVVKKEGENKKLLNALRGS